MSSPGLVWRGRIRDAGRLAAKGREFLHIEHAGKPTEAVALACGLIAAAFAVLMRGALAFGKAR